MTFRNRISLFVATFLIIGFFFLALPEKGITFGSPGLSCCQDTGSCTDSSKGVVLICSVEPVMGSFCNEATGLCEPRTSVDVPTLSEWGLVAMAGILGIVGYLVIRRRKVTA
ncbi:MAG: IPTL-CTERM sorting domain-containing protein [Candidatus Dadabacteria bacterium]|nr:IPTL-CTERM sorting domain-containing protein [Candidatus Dadabacteria bacterium]